jgi:tetratricopeptide (TPR) repeat protein
MQSDRSSRALLVGLVLLAAVVPYLDSLQVPWHFDDHVAILQNPRVATPANWPLLLRYEYRPLLQLTFALNHYFGGTEVLGFHWINIALHAVNAILLMLLILALLRLVERRPPSRTDWHWAALTAALFAANPLHSEAVTYISARSESLAAAFYLGALLIALRALHSPPKSWCALLAIAAVLVLQVLGLASKETAVTLLPVLLVATWLFRPETLAALRRRAGVLLPAATAGLLLLGGWGVARVREYWQFGIPLSLLDYWRTEIVCVFLYARKLALPIALNVDPDVRLVRSWVDPRFLLALIGLILALIFLWRRRRSNPMLALAGFWFLIALLPPALVPLKDVLAEHRAYLPGVAGALLITTALRSLWRGLSVPAATLWSLVMAFGLMTWERNRDYQSEIRLWTDTAGKSPLKSRPRMNRGVAYLRAGDPRQAEADFEAALRLNPTDVDALVNLGLLRWQKGEKSSAIELIQRALTVKPDSARAWASLGAMQLSLGETERARSSYQRALHFDSGQPQALRGMALLTERSGNLQRSLQYWITLSQILPLDPEPLRQSARLALKLGSLPAAEESLRLWLALEPDNVEAQSMLADVLARKAPREPAAGPIR